MGRGMRLKIGSLSFGLFGSVLAVLALVGLAPAFACTPSASIEVRPARGEANSLVDFSGTLFDPSGSPVEIWWGGGSGRLLATVAVDGNGRIGGQVRIPAGSRPGYYLVMAAHRDSQGRTWTPSTTFEIPGSSAQPQPAPPTSPARTDQPARTGQPSGTPQPSSAPRVAAGPGVAPQGQSAPGPAGQLAPAGEGALDPGTAPAGDPAQEAVSGQPGDAVQPIQLPPPDVVQPREMTDPGEFGTRKVHASGPPAWILVPVFLLGVLLFSGSSAVFLHEVRHQRRAKARI